MQRYTNVHNFMYIYMKFDRSFQNDQTDSILYTNMYTNVDTRGRVHGIPME